MQIGDELIEDMWLCRQLKVKILDTRQHAHMIKEFLITWQVWLMEGFIDFAFAETLIENVLFC